MCKRKESWKSSQTNLDFLIYFICLQQFLTFVYCFRFSQTLSHLTHIGSLQEPPKGIVSLVWMGKPMLRACVRSHTVRPLTLNPMFFLMCHIISQSFLFHHFLSIRTCFIEILYTV